MLGIVLAAAGFWALHRWEQARQLAAFHALLHEAEQRIVATVKAEATAEAVEKAPGMVKDIVGTRGQPEPAVNRFEQAIEAEARHEAWVRRILLFYFQAEVVLQENKG